MYEDYLQQTNNTPHFIPVYVLLITNRIFLLTSLGIIDILPVYKLHMSISK